jgi:hypothetical protein
MMLARKYANVQRKLLRAGSSAKPPADSAKPPAPTLLQSRFKNAFMKNEPI